MKIHDFVIAPDGRPGFITEVHAKGKSVKIDMIGNCKKPRRVICATKKATIISREAAWKLAIPYSMND